MADNPPVENAIAPSAGGSDSASLKIDLDVEIQPLTLNGFSSVKIDGKEKFWSTGLVVDAEHKGMLEMVIEEFQRREQWGVESVYLWSQELQLMALKIAQLRQRYYAMLDARAKNQTVDAAEAEQVAQDLYAAEKNMREFMDKYQTLDAYQELMGRRIMEAGSENSDNDNNQS